MKHNHKAFTMLELVFVIVVIGILSAIAIPKFAANRDDATIAKAKTTINAVRSALATERQKRIMSGQFSSITKLSSDTGYDKPMFDQFVYSNATTGESVLEYPETSCANDKAQGCWVMLDVNTYTYKMPVSGTVDFNITNNRFNCELPNDPNCILLTR